MNKTMFQSKLYLALTVILSIVLAVIILPVVLFVWLTVVLFISLSILFTRLISTKKASVKYAYHNGKIEKVIN